MKIALIRWKDCTHYDDSAMTEEEVKSEELIEMVDVGFVVEENSERVAIAQEWIEEQGRYRHVTWVPVVNIVSKKYLSFK